MFIIFNSSYSNKLDDVSDHTDGQNTIVIISKGAMGKTKVTDITNTVAVVGISRPKPPKIRFKLKIRPDSRLI